MAKLIVKSDEKVCKYTVTRAMLVASLESKGSVGHVNVMRLCRMVVDLFGRKLALHLSHMLSDAALSDDRQCFDLQPEELAEIEGVH